MVVAVYLMREGAILRVYHDTVVFCVLSRLLEHGWHTDTAIRRIHQPTQTSSYDSAHIVVRPARGHSKQICLGHDSYCLYLSVIACLLNSGRCDWHAFILVQLNCDNLLVILCCLTHERRDIRHCCYGDTSLENPSIQTHLVLLCCIKRLCIFGPKGAIQIHYYYYYYYYWHWYWHWLSQFNWTKRM